MNYLKCKKILFVSAVFTQPSFSSAEVMQYKDDTLHHSRAVFMLWSVEKDWNTLLKNGFGCRVPPLLHELKPKSLKLELVY